MRHIYHVAADEYRHAYRHVVNAKINPHPKQYQQECAIECSGDPSSDSRELPSDIHTLMSVFRQARMDNGSVAPELGTLLQAQASGLALSKSLAHAGHPGYQVY